MNKRTLAYEVSDVLEMPRDWNHGLSFKIVKAVFQAITEAVRNGETVTVRGFGTFKPKLRTKSNQRLQFWGTSHVEFMTAITKHAHFTPSPSLLRYINET